MHDRLDRREQLEFRPLPFRYVLHDAQHAGLAENGDPVGRDQAVEGLSIVGPNLDFKIADGRRRAEVLFALHAHGRASPQLHLGRAVPDKLCRDIARCCHERLVYVEKAQAVQCADRHGHRRQLNAVANRSSL